ncbi:interferon-induced very large GTPase 1-like [Sardina pilchardus]|uniref:interferon-induced very large GTPase 1-like n=1 Tax=Sardina pilchardus TaxID=27697 RepID=UPI002E13B3F9
MERIEQERQHQEREKRMKEEAEERLRREMKEKEERKRRMTEEMEKHILVRLLLDERITSADVLTISPHSVHHQEAITDKEIFCRFLQMLLTGNYNARYPLVSEKHGRAQIHPMDVQMAVFHRADHFLKQLIVTKLSQCQYALPLLVPNPFTQEIEFPLWTFQQIKKSWKITNTKHEVISKGQSVCKADTPMVAFFRLGSVSSSKSQLMNSLINEKHNTFFHRNCPGSSRTRLLMDGVVEIAWYCPSGKPTDKFTDCVAFCNLHGDAAAHPLQTRIMMEMATINVVLLSELLETGDNLAIVQELFESPKPLICILTEDDDPITEVEKGKYKLGFKSRNQSDVSAELILAIRQTLSEGTVWFKLDNVLCYREIKVDTESEECRKGKTAAVRIMDLVKTKDLLEVKETFLPCHGKLWHDWSELSKDLHGLQGENLEWDTSSKLKRMKDIRHKQRANGLTELMRLFTGYLKTLSDIEKKYFLEWVGNLLDDFASNKLSDLLQEYNVKWKWVLDLKKTCDKSKQMEKQNDLEKISNNLTVATFGLEHFLREMGQVYEAWKSTQKDVSGKEDITIPSLPKMAAELMISGHPMELMDGDAAHVPLIWVTAVLDALIKIVGDQRVFVLSVLGLQSSGKSTMLNAMFGLQFAVSAGRCTRGAFMQLVRVSEEMRTKLKFDYILVVDTEGLRALELAGKATVHHDNELATFVVGLGNMTLINIFGKNPSEMQDILQIVVQAFLRMKQVKLNPSCIFVHQNVTDITAGEKNMVGRRHFQDKLDEMTKLAAKEEVCDAECFSDVIAFDIQKDVKDFAQLWEGSPPMAPPNPSYSENIQELKKTILTHASTSSGFTLTEFKTRIKDLWDALLNEDFVFSFKNTLEITAYRALEEEYGKWTWTLRSEMLKMEDQLHTMINNYRLHEVNNALLAKNISETLENVQKDMSQYFDNDTLKDILIQWKVKFELKIKELHEDLVEKGTKKLKDFISQRDARKKLDEKKGDHEKKLFEKSKELALKLKQKGISEGEMKSAFDSMWEDWVSEFKNNTTPISDINIRQNMLNILYETFQYGLGYNRTATDIAVEMKTNIPAFSGNRSNLEKHILKLLVEEESFSKFMTYIQNPREHFECFIKEEVVKYIRKSTTAGMPIILFRIKDHIMELQRRVISAAARATQEAKANNGKLWMHIFSKSLSDVLENRCTGLNCENVNDFDLLAEIIKRELPRVTEELKSDLSSLGDLNMEMFREGPDEILIKHFCQCCWEQCPFCGAICTNTMEDHYGDHMVPFHRVAGLKGFKNEGKFSLDFCTTLVISDKKFTSDSIPYKRYRSAGGKYAEWSISPDCSELPHWKWFVCRFQTELENQYRTKLESMVAEWRRYSKADALKSLDFYF